jgi:hypothetical protein
VDEIQKDLSELQKEHAAQEKLQADTQSNLAKLRKAQQYQEQSYQKLDARYKALQQKDK